ncbi:MAG: hypothetical protein QW562_07880 [Thermosphaera sp.]
MTEPVELTTLKLTIELTEEEPGFLTTAYGETTPGYSVKPP